MALCKNAEVEYVELPVANDALTVVVNTENDWVTCLTVDQLKKIWEPGSKVDSWQDVDPSFPDTPASAVRAGNGLGHIRLLHRRRRGQGGDESLRLPGI